MAPKQYFGMTTARRNPSNDKRRWPRAKDRIRRYWRALGPGIVTGAADDDPSGIATYAITGAEFGTALLWLAPLTWPLTATVQGMCSRIGMVTGEGLMSALRRKFPKWVLVFACGSLLIANTINVGADLAGMADAADMLVGLGPRFWAVVFGIALALTTVKLGYAALARVLRWLALALLAYVVAAVQLKPDWGAVLHASFIPTLPHAAAGWSAIVAVLGTTISPYLFFWQTAEEVEEEKGLGRRTVHQRRGARIADLHDRRLDIAAGSFFAIVAMFAIMLTTALTLHQHGILHPASSRDVAMALRPLGGHTASLLFTIGLVGTGALAIPTLAGSAAYAFAELFHWREGMDESFNHARAFYAIILLSLAVGIGFTFAGTNPIALLYASAVINGILAPFLLVAVLLVASDRKLMRDQPSGPVSRIVVAATAMIMFGALGLMVAFG